MSGYILCEVKKADKPYYIKNICTNIYSIEELCYYFYHNLYLIDRSIMNEELCDWIEEELHCRELAEKLRHRVGKFAVVEDVLYPVFKEINYLTYDELKKLSSRVARYDAESPLVREKKKADALAANGMYVHAIKVYQELLKKPRLEEAKNGLTVQIWHNLGCVYSYLFQMEKTLDCFEQAIKAGGGEKEQKAYLMAYKTIRTPIEYESKLTELGFVESIPKEIEEDLERFARKPERKVYVQHVDELLTAFMKDYHRSTGS
ncbi:MAG: hypothetical protein HUJ72_03430 [Blautia sp.]|nr:hypothetical protein [Blautia sp.]